MSSTGKRPPAPPWRKGQSGNPSGKPKGLLTNDQVKATLGKFWSMSKEDLLGILKNEKSTMGELMIASVMARAAKDGDANRLNFLLDRSIGKVSPEEIVAAAIQANALNAAAVWAAARSTLELPDVDRPAAGG